MFEKLKLSPAIIVALVSGVFAIFGVVYAYQNFNPLRQVIVQGNYIEAPLPVQPEVAIPEQGSDPTLGSVTSPYLTNSSIGVNNDITYSLVKSFSGANATTTLISFPDPFLTVTTTGIDVVLKTDAGGQNWTGATSTVTLARLFFTGSATTSFSVDCTAASTPIATTSISLLSTTAMTTSSIGMIENNLSAAQGGLKDAGTVAKITLTPKNPYFNCVAIPQSSTNFVSSTANALFAGKATVRVNRTLGS